jgi:pimeloyl-ACP methyl ester carboxylesterase
LQLNGGATVDPAHRHRHNIAVPAITLDGDTDGVAPASDGTSYAKKFSRKRTHRIIKGIGHNLPHEAPQAFAKAIVDVDGY